MLLLVVYMYVSSASLIVVRPKADTGRRQRRMPEGGKCERQKAAEGGYRKADEGGYRIAAEGGYRIAAEGGYRIAAKVAEGEHASVLDG